jgi:hypothetical protein
MYQFNTGQMELKIPSDFLQPQLEREGFICLEMQYSSRVHSWCKVSLTQTFLLLTAQLHFN